MLFNGAIAIMTKARTWTVKKNNREIVHTIFSTLLPYQFNDTYRFCYLLLDWVISLGPEKDGLYEYSVATDPMKMGLYVLARDVETFRQKYEHEVLQFVREQGFIYPINKPIPIPQNDKCLYPPQTLKHDASEL